MVSVKTTQEKYKINDTYTKDRSLLHEKIINHFMDDNHKVSQIPEAILLGGGTASGKTSAGNFIIRGYKEAGVSLIKIDADEIKRLIPEYEKMSVFNPESAAFHVHDESSDIVDELLIRCIKNQKNFLYDGTMKNLNKYRTLIHNLINSGYKVSATIVDVPIEIAKEREHYRYKETNRKVPYDVLIESHTNVPKTFHILKDMVHEYIIYDATEEGLPVEIAEKTEDGEEIIYDKEKLENFYKKSGIKL
ncbi:zeta toxin family protein [Bacillus sp. BB56-3]|uniref:zeta toxin family protein n=1 Tax=Bacillus sp. BB56-3 TaxID=2217831 RepID=UPI0011ED77FF|nr:zeta toxin family protein [Bacillus sp. BB56-3]KAA0780084.1 Zeta toxin [Bacillus sp. BB56-3]